MTDAIRDGLARAISDADDGAGLLGGDAGCFADAALAHLRERIPGFDALLDGSAVVVPRTATDKMIVALQYLALGDAGGASVEKEWPDVLAASPFAGEK